MELVFSQEDREANWRIDFICAVNVEIIETGPGQGAQQSIARFHLGRIVPDTQPQSFHLKVCVRGDFKVPEAQTIDIRKHVSCPAQPVRP